MFPKKISKLQFSEHRQKENTKRGKKLCKGHQENYKVIYQKL